MPEVDDAYITPNRLPQIDGQRRARLGGAKADRGEPQQFDYNLAQPRLNCS
jgi:hypothetical protein